MFVSEPQQEKADELERRERLERELYRVEEEERRRDAEREREDNKLHGNDDENIVHRTID